MKFRFWLTDLQSKTKTLRSQEHTGDMDVLLSKPTLSRKVWSAWDPVECLALSSWPINEYILPLFALPVPFCYANQATITYVIFWLLLTQHDWFQLSPISLLISTFPNLATSSPCCLTLRMGWACGRWWTLRGERHTVSTVLCCPSLYNHVHDSVAWWSRTQTES